MSDTAYRVASQQAEQPVTPANHLILLGGVALDAGDLTGAAAVYGQAKGDYEEAVADLMPLHPPAAWQRVQTEEISAFNHLIRATTELEQAAQTNNAALRNAGLHQMDIATSIIKRMTIEAPPQ